MEETGETEDKVKIRHFTIKEGGPAVTETREGGREETFTRKEIAEKLVKALKRQVEKYRSKKQKRLFGYRERVKQVLKP